MIKQGFSSALHRKLSLPAPRPVVASKQECASRWPNSYRRAMSYLGSCHKRIICSSLVIDSKNDFCVEITRSHICFKKSTFGRVDNAQLRIIPTIICLWFSFVSPGNGEQKSLVIFKRAWNVDKVDSSSTWKTTSLMAEIWLNILF